MKKIKLTPKNLKQIIKEEKDKLKRLGLLPESKDNQDQHNVDKFIEQYGKLTLQEAKLREKLRSVRVLKEKLARTIKKRS